MTTKTDIQENMLHNAQAIGSLISEEQAVHIRLLEQLCERDDIRAQLLELGRPLLEGAQAILREHAPNLEDSLSIGMIGATAHHMACEEWDAAQSSNEDGT